MATQETETPIIEANQYTFYNESRELTLGAIYEGIPVVGWALSGVLRVLFPEKGKIQDTWSSIQDQVYAAIEKKLSKAINSEIKSRGGSILAGIYQTLEDYKDAPKEKYESTLIYISGQVANLRSENEEVVLLPAFAQAAQLHLFFLREGIDQKTTLGLSEKLYLANQKELRKYIGDYSNYAKKWYKKGLDQLSAWEDRNTYQRNYTISVTDLQAYWPYLDSSTYSKEDLKNPDVVPKLTREVFGDTHGNGGVLMQDSFFKEYDLQAKYGKISRITVIGRKDRVDRIQGVQVTYGMKKAGKTGSGTYAEANLKDSDHYHDTRFDDGVGRMRTTPYLGGVIDVDDSNPIVAAWGYSDKKDNPVVLGLGFTFQDGTKTSRMGANGSHRFDVKIDGHILSSIVGAGVDGFKLVKGGLGFSMGRVAFGFRLANSYDLIEIPLYQLYKRGDGGDMYDFTVDKKEYEKKQKEGWKGEEAPFSLIRNVPGEIGIFKIRSKSDSDSVQLVLTPQAYNKVDEKKWVKEGYLGSMYKNNDEKLPNLKPLYILEAKKPVLRNMLETDEGLYNAQLTVGWSATPGNKIKGYVVS